jgi:hypothetical protein
MRFWIKKPLLRVSVAAIAQVMHMIGKSTTRPIKEDKISKALFRSMSMFDIAVHNSL